MSYRRNLPFSLCALSFARDLIGVRESGHNRGPAVEMIQRAAGIPPGSPWCAAFVNAAAEYAQMVKDVRSPLEEVPLQGLVHSYYEHGLQNGWIYSDQPYPGSLFLVWNRAKQRYSHIGFVGEYLGNGLFTTVEGNSNTSGSAEGREVVVNVRRREAHDVTLDWTAGIEPRVVNV